MRPGIDYALTEAVRCKSQRAIGVELAVDSCAERYMKQTIELSSARVIVCMGNSARRALLVAFLKKNEVDLMEAKLGAGMVEPMASFSALEGDERQVLFMRHSGAFGAPDKLAPSIVRKLRPLLSSSSP